MDRESNSNRRIGNFILFFLLLTVTAQHGWTELLQSFKCPSNGKTYQGKEIKLCPAADPFASYVLGFSSFDTALQAVTLQDVDTLAAISKEKIHAFWSIVLHSEQRRQSHSLERVWQWVKETQTKACKSPESSVCKTITGGLLSYYLFSPNAVNFIRLPDVKPVVRDSMVTLHKQLFSMSPEDPVVRLRQQVVANIAYPENIQSQPDFNCHLGSFIDPLTEETQSFLKGDHSNEILNFIWFGPNFPSQYAQNIWAWADAYPDLTVVLWYSSVGLGDNDLLAYSYLPEKRVNLWVRDIKDAGLELIDVQGINVGKLLDKILLTDLPVSSGIRYASASDFARVALVAKGGAALSDGNPDSQKKTMIYFDLDVTFFKTCGFQPLKNRKGETYINLYNSEEAEKYSGLYPPVDILASKQAKHPDILKMLDYLTEIYQDLMDGKRLLKNTRLPIAFDGAMDEVIENNDSPPHRFPLLWSLPLHGSDQIWKDDPNALLLKTWKNEVFDMSD